MRRIAISTVALVTALVGCGDDDSAVGPAFQYTLEPPAGEVAVGQDSTVSLIITVLRSGTDTIKNVRLYYQSADVDIATVDANGVVTGVSGGATTITASGPGGKVDVPVTVRGHPATSVELTVLSGPAGGRLATNFDTGTFYALPGDPATSRLKAVVRVGNDTVFCNYCGTKTPARVQRIVRFRSLDENLATVTNATNPRLQASTDTTGRVTPLDTTSTAVRIVVEVPSDDNMADTVYLKFKLRPIDTLRIRPDSGFFPTTNGTGLQKRQYDNADTLQANVVATTTTNFVAGITFLSRVQDLPGPTSSSNPSPRFIPLQPTGGPTVRRVNLPSVLWESANTDYLSINAAGALIGKCAFIGGTCPATGSSVLTCNSTGGTMPALFGGLGTYAIPHCTTPSIPMPGAFCSTTSSSDLSATCTVWVRATANDPVTNKVLRRLYRVNIRR